MGYIFDALNKKKDGESANEQHAADETCDIAAPTESSETGLAQLMEDARDRDAQAESENESENEGPLRLSDLDLSLGLDTSGEAVVTASDEPDGALDHESPMSALPFDQTDDEAVAPVEVPSIDEPVLQLKSAKKPGLIGRLLGRHSRHHVDDRIVAMTSPASAMSEEYRSIRTSILARHDNQRHLVHTITSATPQEGKTITCVNLGMSFAELRNRKTIIIECDLRLPTFAKLLNCDASRPGLIDYLHGDVKVSEIIQHVEGSQLHIIPAGGMVSDEAVQLLSSQRMSRLIQGLRAKYDHVIIDTPPVLQLADAGILGSQSEEVLVVARMRRTPRPLVEQAINTLTSYNAQVSGIIATDNPRSRGRGYGYKYGYRYSYGYTPDRKGRRKKRRAA